MVTEYDYNDFLNERNQEKNPAKTPEQDFVPSKDIDTAANDTNLAIINDIPVGEVEEKKEILEDNKRKQDFDQALKETSEDKNEQDALYRKLYDPNAVSDSTKELGEINEDGGFIQDVMAGLGVGATQLAQNVILFAKGRELISAETAANSMDYLGEHLEDFEDKKSQDQKEYEAKVNKEIEDVNKAEGFVETSKEAIDLVTVALSD